MANKENVSLDKLRKLMECASKGTNVATIVLTDKASEKIKRKDNNEAPITRGKRTIIEIRPNRDQGQNYASVLSTMKKSIDTDKTGIQIKNIEQTHSGNLKLSMAQVKEGALTSFKKQAEEILKGKAVTVLRKGDMKTMILRDLEIDVSESIIRKDINVALQRKEGEAEITLQSLKENRKGFSKVAIISMDNESADVLLQERRVRVGWVHCRIQELVSPDRCWRCKGFGHTSKECNSEELELKGVCFRCNKTGHIAKGCKETPNCYICKVEGHKADSMACPRYRETVRALRKKIYKEKSENGVEDRQRDRLIEQRQEKDIETNQECDTEVEMGDDIQESQNNRAAEELTLTNAT